MTELIISAVALGNQIERFGSYFGYAAVIGLGVLSLLYFTQAREVKRLREWAGRAPERDAELAQRVQSDAQRRVVAQPVPAPVPAAQPASPQTVAAQQADAARRAAAAAVMQKFQQPSPGASPALGPPGQLARPAGAPGSVPQPGGPPAPVPGSPGTNLAPGSVPGAFPGSSGPSPAAGAPTTAVPGPPVQGSPAPTAATTGAAAAAAARQAVTPGRSPVLGNGSGGQDTHESAAARPASLPDPPPRPPRASTSSADDGDLSGGRIGLIVGGVVAVLVVAVVLVLLLTSGGESPPADNAVRDASPPPAVAPPPSASRVDRKETQVAVLNGTSQTGLASAVARKIEKGGFTILSTGNNSDQQIATTTVAYADGDESAARTVADIMGVSDAAVKEIDVNTAAAVAAEANVVVIVGNNLSSAG